MWRRRSSRADEEIFGLYLRAVRFGAPPASVSLKASQSFAAGRRKKIRSFSPATCASEKILFRLQVWTLYATGAQSLCAADCKPFGGKPLWVSAIRKKTSAPNGTEVFDCVRVDYLSSTEAPTSSSFFLSSSASSLETCSLMAQGMPSTFALASAKPRLVISRTALMTLIF